jgi:hypothetical protein
MRITKAALNRRWAISTLLAIAVFAVLAALDVRLRTLSGVATTDLQGYAVGAQYHLARAAWLPGAFALRAGFALGLDYLFMPLYAASFFLSGIIAREAFSRPPSSLYRLLTILAAVPVAGALLDACENALELWMLLNGGGDRLARIAFTVSNAKMAAVYVGLVLLAGAILARAQEHQKRRMKTP